MTTLFEANLGYVNCDIDGEGYNRIEVYYDEWSPEESAYSFFRHSNCYGDLTEKNIARDRVATLLRENAFLVATRRARKTYDRFVRKVESGRPFIQVNSPQAPQGEQMELLFDEASAPEPPRCECPSCRPDPTPSETAPWYTLPSLIDLTVLNPGTLSGGAVE